MGMSIKEDWQSLQVAIAQVDQLEGIVGTLVLLQ
jgi:hypothetical protein